MLSPVGGVRNGEAERGAVRRARAAALAAAALLGLLLVVLPGPWTLESGAGFPSPSGRPLRDTVFAAVYWVAAGELFVVLLLAATASLWAREPERAPSAPGWPRLPRTGWLALFACAVLAVGLRLPLAGSSLWWDEAWSMRRVVTGQAVPSAEDPTQLEVKRPPWSRPFFDYRKPTNHVVYNAMGRASVEVAQTVRGSPPWVFDELAFRLPALVASALAVIAMGLLVTRMGWPALAPVAALLLAVHPWHVRYGAEARAYGLVLLFALAAALALQGALARGRWRDWLAFGATQLALLWTQPSAIYLVVCFGVGAALRVALGAGPVRDRAIGLGRLAVSGVAAALVFALVMAPNIAQSLAWTDVFQEQQRIYAAVLRDLWVNVAIGMQDWTGVEAQPPEAYATLPVLAAERPWVVPFVNGLLPLVCGAGLVRLAWRSRDARTVLLVMLGGMALALYVTHARQMYYYHRFVIYALVPLVAGLVAGWDLPVAALTKTRAQRAVRAAWLLAGVAAYQAVVWPQTRLLLTRPVAPMREVGAYLRGLSGDDPTRVLRGGLGLGGEMPALYDPWLRSLQTEEAFQALLAEAERTGAPLVIAYAYRGQNEPRFPAAFALLDDPEHFEPMAEWRGVEIAHHYRVFCARSDCDRVRGPERE